jgi:hypothetical protein
MSLASHTGWSEAEILGMKESRFTYWLEGIPGEST